MPKRPRMTAQALASMALPISDPLESIIVSKPRHVRLADEWIEWRAPIRWKEGGEISLESLEESHWAAGEYSDRILWEFVDLAEQDDPAVFLDFAQRYGVLLALQAGENWLICAEGTPLPARVKGEQDWYREAIATWRAIAWHFGTILQLASYLKDQLIVPGTLWAASEGLLQTNDDWFHARWRGATPEAFEQTFKQPLAEMHPDALWILYHSQTEKVAERLSALLDAATLVPRASWFSYRAYPQITLTPDLHYRLWEHTGATGWSLFPILATQLAAALGPDVLLDRCLRCGKAYETNRKSRTDQPHYCPRCRPFVRRATVRASVAKSRSAKRQRADHEHGH